MVVKLQVGIVAPPWVPVPPTLYGGTEAVIDTLARGLIAEGHQVALFASGDSTCPVPLRSLYPSSLGTLGSEADEIRHVAAAYDCLAGQVDVIHDHTFVGPTRLLGRAWPTPVIHTNHGPFTAETLGTYESLARRLPVIAISHAQASTAKSVAVSAVIHHGIDLTKIPFGQGQGGYLAFLGRMNPQKGAHRAVLAARAAGIPIRLAAKMWEPPERAYFEREVKPLLGEDAVYVGELGGADKFNFLAEAAALLNPIRWPEPFGLAMIESMATGTPVLAFPEGAAPEIVQHGVTGFLCRDERDMVALISRIATLERHHCRQRVEECFSATRMVADHVRLYIDTIGGSQDGSVFGRALSVREAVVSTP